MHASNPHESQDIRDTLRELVHRLEHVLPAQAPIKDFVHHNTLHGFQHLPFAQALSEAARLTGASAWLPAERFREFYRNGRIEHADLMAALHALPELNADEILLERPAATLRRADVYLAALLFPFKRLSRSQLKWQVEELRALTHFRDDVPNGVRQRLLQAAGGLDEASALTDLWRACLEVLGLAEASQHPEELVDLSPEEIEALLSRAGQPPDGRMTGVEQIGQALRQESARLLDSLLERLGQSWTLRALLLALTGEDLLHDLRPLMIRYVAAHLDLGIAAWHNPARGQGLYAAWRASAAQDMAFLLSDLPEWREHLERLPEDPVDLVIQELRLLGLAEHRWPRYLEKLALELPGWAGMALWRHNHAHYGGETTPVEMMDFLALRLMLERIFAQRICRRHWRAEASVPGLRGHFRQHPEELLVRHALYQGRMPEYLVSMAQRVVQEALHASKVLPDSEWRRVAELHWRWRNMPVADRRGEVSVSGTAWPLFCLAQHVALSGQALRAWGQQGAQALLGALHCLDADQMGFIWLMAYERHYAEQIFGALAANHGRCQENHAPEAQLVFCMDDREEGTRRHLEEINPRLQTFGAAAHYSVFMNWRGLDDDKVTALCPVVPVVVVPAHEVREAPRAGAEILRQHRRRSGLRQRWKERLHQGTRRGLLSAALLSAAAAPVTALALAGKVLAPAALGRFGERMRQRFDVAVPTRVDFTAPQDAAPATPQAPRAGFTDSEQADRVRALLRNIGLTAHFAPLVVIAGHGSNSQNNPHLSAYDCGACAGRHSGANARVIAAMANRPEVRAMLRERGIDIPDGTWFLGAEHNTCDDIVTWYDTEDIPSALRAAFEKLRGEVAQASRAHAQERCRRLASAPLDIGQQQAWRHVIERRYDFSQARPELGHATNACAFIGRRSMSRGAFFDRRAFLISYDPTLDADGSVLEGLLRANGPVGAGISLEYYFSTVNNEQYGCGTKIMHNVSGLFGVMEGAGSDLRTGLPSQMVEIHEAMRLLVVVEAKLEVITAIYQRQAGLQELIGNGWLLVAAKDPDHGAIHRFDPARGWVLWQGQGASVPTVASSYDWFAGQREPLPPALLTRPLEAA